MNIINQVYWDQFNETYMFGTKLIKKQDGNIFFKNELMAAGIKIMKWSSSLNYQANKEVPRLPILMSNMKYFIKIKIKVEPENTAIFCLRFFDLQGTEINKDVFTNTEKMFVYPERAVSYTFEIINGGCNELEFYKFQIGRANLEKEAFDGFYVMPINNCENIQKRALILVADNKRSREIIHKSNFSNDSIQIMIGYISWQSLFNLSGILIDWLKNQHYKKLIIFSSDKRIDKALKDIQFNDSYIKLVTSPHIMQNQVEHDWFLPEMVIINQNDLLNNVEQYLRK